MNVFDTELGRFILDLFIFFLSLFWSKQKPWNTSFEPKPMVTIMENESILLIDIFDWVTMVKIAKNIFFTILFIRPYHSVFGSQVGIGCWNYILVRLITTYLGCFFLFDFISFLAFLFIHNISRMPVYQILEWFFSSIEY